ncbi:crotonase/enoyl-CoA hydratase family protein [Leclercia adecarboxylata]|jgi:DSF synthase|uniref:Crotonase/enoyl-CoA hydratase family protein n=1 Tax=Leclercia adecarboxylata TaxID=83655 RepID=A0ABU6I6F5_9ENTR|nr:crotonase/enoyl-CoA hydratase family protein [Leclercia adecarboxylata]MBZ3799322.1 crotonase/enoyl-CoA hydratase family protein [Leclercia adecarboxylata]MBZ3803518.1 crotonase/enoyl-CoA hydratase family protein [Leclercia adecarboxylata]MCE9983000.1 crotonase/enoyl-CoA hydratase family protein [Leclercia adecarboxylata]MDV5239695.1 crotonase/enoyl-CoA hydratase family protein [Leclercia adecarboxylata]MDV5276258.1 crotonase/enoyl-CoA hydratase family protein [Leclercia adecarboxylata]
MTIINQATCKLFTDSARFTQLAGYYEEERRTVWMMLRAQPRPCFNHALIEEIMNLSWLVRQSGFDVDFWVTGSLVPDMYNTGGDLRFFVDCIENGRREALRAYARACVDCVHAASRGFDTGAITLSMVEGSALGGGFEAALAHHFLLAQRDARLGFPEIAFNLFPGMGGYSLVARRSGMKLAEELIYKGESHTAEWYEQQGLVDVLFEPGQGYVATRTFIDTLQPKMNGVRAMLRARQRVMQLPRSELMDITEDWVEAAFCLQPKDVAYMQRLVHLQDRHTASGLRKAS